MEAKSVTLLKFGEELQPKEDEIRRANEGVEYLQNLISQNMKKSFSVARSVSSGSCKRKTAISGHFDIDIIFFFKISLVDFLINRIKFCDEMVRILLENNVIVKRKNEKNVCCEYKGIEYDLVTAICLHPSDWRQQHQEICKLVETQKGEREKRNFHWQLCSSLSETMSELVSRMDSYTHCLCRLAKYWMFTQLPGVDFYSKSSTIELLAVKAAEMTLWKQDILKGYRQFLTLMSEIEIIHTAWKKNYGREKITKWIIKYNPLLLDPCDPFINSLHCYTTKPEVASFFMSAAKKSLKVLDNWEQSSSVRNPEYLFMEYLETKRTNRCIIL